MLKIVQNKRDIAIYQHKFEELLKNSCKEEIECTLGHQGRQGNEKVLVFYSGKYDFWFRSFPHNNRYWNGFGLGKPNEQKNNPIIVEINIPYHGINRRIGGVFGTDDEGGIHLFHRGNIGGGRTGIGKQFFFNDYQIGDFILQEGNKADPLAVVASLDSIDFPVQIASFIKEVHRIKSNRLGQDKKKNFPPIATFKEEHFGAGQIDRGTIEVIRRHGIVVNSLYKELTTRGYTACNDQNRDLFLLKRNKITDLFEIKTSTRSQHVYTGIGQLLFHNLSGKEKNNMVLVLPDKLTASQKKRLNILGIKVLYYSWHKGIPVFEKLDAQYSVYR